MRQLPELSRGRLLVKSSGRYDAARMALLTAITEDDARALLALHGRGPLEALQPLLAGSVNSNFALRAGGERFFLRLYEEQDAAGARAEAAMVERLAAAGVPSA